jgi:hypothetical protein
MDVIKACSIEFNHLQWIKNNFLCGLCCYVVKIILVRKTYRVICIRVVYLGYFCQKTLKKVQIHKKIPQNNFCGIF